MDKGFLSSQVQGHASKPLENLVTAYDCYPALSSLQRALSPQGADLILRVRASCWGGGGGVLEASLCKEAYLKVFFGLNMYCSDRSL